MELSLFIATVFIFFVIRIIVKSREDTKHHNIMMQSFRHRSFLDSVHPLMMRDTYGVRMHYKSKEDVEKARGFYLMGADSDIEKERIKNMDLSYYYSENHPEQTSEYRQKLYYANFWRAMEQVGYTRKVQ